MQAFNPVVHAITGDGEWITIEKLPPGDQGQLLCGSCHAIVVVRKDESGRSHFFHLLHNEQELIKTRRCCYAIRPPVRKRSAGTGMILSGPVKPPKPAMSIPLLPPRNLLHPTVFRNWICTWCNHRYTGNKQCPKCHEWVYTIEAGNIPGEA